MIQESKVDIFLSVGRACLGRNHRTSDIPREMETLSLGKARWDSPGGIKVIPSILAHVYLHNRRSIPMAHG